MPAIKRQGRPPKNGRSAGTSKVSFEPTRPQDSVAESIKGEEETDAAAKLALEESKSGTKAAHSTEQEVIPPRTEPDTVTLTAKTTRWKVESDGAQKEFTTDLLKSVESKLLQHAARNKEKKQCEKYRIRLEKFRMKLNKHEVHMKCQFVELKYMLEAAFHEVGECSDDEGCGQR